MFKALKKVQQGFTIIELLIVIAIIAILALLVINNIQNGQAKARDQQRVSDVNALKNKLEDYYNEHSNYPSEANATTLTGIEVEALKDPIGGNEITSNAAVADGTAADAVAAPTADGASTASYLYIPYGCTGTECTGYRLKTFIEKPTATIANPYTQKSLN